MRNLLLAAALLLAGPAFAQGNTVGGDGFYPRTPSGNSSTYVGTGPLKSLFDSGQTYNSKPLQPGPWVGAYHQEAKADPFPALMTPEARARFDRYSPGWRRNYADMTNVQPVLGDKKGTFIGVCNTCKNDWSNPE